MWKVLEKIAGVDPSLLKAKMAKREKPMSSRLLKPNFLHQLLETRIHGEIGIDHRIADAIQDTGTRNSHPLIIGAVEMVKCLIDILKPSVYKGKIQVEIHMRFFELALFHFDEACIGFVSITAGGISMGKRTQTF